MLLIKLLLRVIWGTFLLVVLTWLRPYISDLKLRNLEHVEIYRKWNSLLQDMAKNKCHGCIKLEEHMKLAKEIKGHKEEVKALKFQMSDKALQQMPEFLGRVI